MASRTLILLLALAFAVVLLVTSEVAAAKDLATNPDSEIDGHGGYNNGGGGYNNDGGHGGRVRRRVRRRVYKRCRHGCCGRRYHGGCKCCSSFAEATAYKQTQN
ncbi:hypothetical protein L6452_00699 [Arctium lappa]|uniref:Uncharacterized protein n=1 Tax=Arctium lappa TaxID=4217 RepID=A0ACB9FEN0_ARCLA|nr:hypothetical protein L6452_00699 [Arctium lappa]